MEDRQRWSNIVLVIFLTLFRDISGLSITVNDVEWYEYVMYEGDTVTGNFVVTDHDIFWSSDHPGIDFVVTSPGGNTIHTLREALESVTAEQKYLKASDARHRHSKSFIFLR